jgi:bifunctional oligoribonuclease and PAP phosphatase NrnA
MIDFYKLKQIINENSSFLITTHINPDPDAIGSEIAFYEVLKMLGKKAKVINCDSLPYNLKFLDSGNVIEAYNEVNHKNIFSEADVLIAVDFNRSERLTSMKNAFIESGKLKICIDHHQDTEDFVDFAFVDSNYSATGHIIFDFIKKTKIVELTYDIAYPVYAAIATDTGSFRFERTTPELHRIAAELLEQGVNPGVVFDKIYDQSHFGRIKLLGKALESIKLYGNDKEIAYMYLSQDDFSDAGAEENDTDGFVNFSLSIEKVKIGMLFVQLNNGFKVSFRSKGTIPMNKLAFEFGGGGHINAAGARLINKSLDEYIPQILTKAEEYLNRNSGN